MSEKHHEPDHSQWDISSSNPQWRPRRACSSARVADAKHPVAVSWAMVGKMRLKQEIWRSDLICGDEHG